MGIIVIRRTVHELHCQYPRSLAKGGRGVDKWRTIKRRSNSGAEVSARECAAARCLTSDRIEAFLFFIYAFAY